MSQASYPRSNAGRGARPQPRRNDVYTLLLALAALFLLLATVLLAVEQFTFYGGLFPPVSSKPAGGKALGPVLPGLPTAVTGMPRNGVPYGQVPEPA